MSGPIIAGARVTGVSRTMLADLAPLLQRALALDPAAVTRLRVGERSVSALIRLPFDVLVGRAIAVAPRPDPDPDDLAGGERTVAVADLLAWLDGAAHPEPREQAWRGATPPPSGWQRIDTVPATVVRDIVAKAGQALREAAEREGVPGGTPRAAVVDSLLDSVVLTVTADPLAGATGGPAHRPVEITLRLLMALTRMDFVADCGDLGIDACGRWVRGATRVGSAYAERPGLGLTLLR